jgi:hypothetical protein
MICQNKEGWKDGKMEGRFEGTFLWSDVEKRERERKTKKE